MNSKEQQKDKSPVSDEGTSDTCCLPFWKYNKVEDKQKYPKDFLFRVKRQREVDVKLPDDTNNCSIWSALVSWDGSLLVTDWENKKLKRVDVDTEIVKDYITLAANPMGLCRVSQTEALVCLVNKTLQFLSHVDMLIITRTLTLDHCCSDVAYSNENIFVADGFECLYIHNMDGKEIRKIKTDSSGREIFKETKQIAVSENGDRVYVADDKKGLIILDNKGDYITTIKEYDTNLLGVSGVCTFGKNVFASSWASRNIVQIGQDNTVFGEVARVSTPWMLCFDPKTLRLFVTRPGSELSVLDLEPP